MQHAMGRALTTLALAFALICCAAVSQARAVGLGGAPPSGWSFDVMPFYLWFPEITGDLTVRGQSDTLDVSIVEWGKALLEDARFAASGRVHARKDRLLFTLDVLGVSIDQNQDFLVVLERDSEFTQVMVEFGVGYHLGNWLLDSQTGFAVAVDVVVGGRYQYINADVDLITETLRLGFGQSADWLEPIIGTMLNFSLSKRFGFFLGGNVGGFGIGSDLTWTITSILQFQLSRRITLFAGYRILDIDYAEGEIHDRFEYDVQMKGPGFGFNIHF